MLLFPKNVVILTILVRKWPIGMRLDRIAFLVVAIWPYQIVGKPI